MAIFKGAGVAIVTPMYEDGKVNYDKLEELLEYQIANSTDAIICLLRFSFLLLLVLIFPY